jgi:2-polyprenyl-3-methyl-5-hydroxy-6-metoxy-1,4-benzoquinol methylase
MRHNQIIDGENIDTLKKITTGEPKYKLSNANVFVSPGGYHYIDYLDPINNISDLEEADLTDEDIEYIEKSLQFNSEKYENHVKIVNRLIPKKNKKVLDIGCGGGLFLDKLKNDSEVNMGIEINDIRVNYAKMKYGINAVKRPIEDDYWASKYCNYFDIVTLWDVVEHVNYPSSTLKSASNTLKSGGFLCIDTPCRDSFYHKFGETTYKLSKGKFPTFLNTMYSAHLYGHKQIFSTSEIIKLFEQANLEVTELKKIHELSFPYSFYLKKLLKSDTIVKISLPLVYLLLYILDSRTFYTYNALVS